jgi:hypothetical protein
VQHVFFMARRTCNCHNPLDKHVVVQPAAVSANAALRAENDDIAG